MHLSWANDLGWQMRFGIKKILPAAILIGFLAIYTNAGYGQEVGLKYGHTKEKPSILSKNLPWPIINQETKRQPFLPKPWCYSELALFCKLEIKLERKTHLPVKFRLGDVRYVDGLEGKFRTY